MIRKYSKEVVKKWPKELDMDIIMISFFDRYGWTEEEFMNTSFHIIDLILAKDEIDYKVNKRKNGN